MQYYFGGLDLAHVWAPHCRSVMGLNLNPEPCTMDLYPELWAWSHQQTSMNQDFKTMIQWLYMWQGSNVSLISWMQHNLPLSLSVYLLACLSLSVCLPACLFSLSLPLSTSHDLSLLTLYLCDSVSLCLLSLALCLSVSLSVCLSVSLSSPVPVSVLVHLYYLSLSVFLTLSICPSPSLSLPSACLSILKTTNILIQPCGLHVLMRNMFCTSQIFVFVARIHTQRERVPVC